MRASSRSSARARASGSRDALTVLAEPLDAGTLAILDEAFADGVAAGARYPQAGMAQLDSERRG